MGSRWAILLGVLALGLAVAGGISYAPDRAHAAQLSCGDTITADTTLDSDLIDCPNNGIVIGADDITLDLNGHVIDGDGTRATGCDLEVEFCDTGVANFDHDGVTVMHGSVREMALGVAVESAHDARVLDISSTRNLFFGFVVIDAARSLVRGNSSHRNPAPDGDGMGLFDSHHVRILHNSFRRNAEPGIHAANSTDNLIKGNVFSRNHPNIVIEGSDRNRVRRNRVVRGSEGILVTGNGNRNVIARNRIFRAGGSGVLIDKGRGNVVAHNLVARARRAGIHLGIKSPLMGGANNTVRRNLVRGSRDDGFLVDKKDGHSLLRRNLARHNGGDGFDIKSRSGKLTGNSAVRNADLGIQAVAGVSDGGGNIARQNGDRRRCTHVACQ